MNLHLFCEDRSEQTPSLDQAENKNFPENHSQHGNTNGCQTFTILSIYGDVLAHTGKQ